jgi:hypothetical protein
VFPSSPSPELFVNRSERVWPVVVIGAGAAGLTAAIFAARHGARVLLLETRPKPGAKIRVSGGGRCNVLPSEATPDDFHTLGSRNAVRNILASWPLSSVRAFFEDDLGIPLKTESTGKVFPVSNRSKDVVQALLDACDAAGVELATDFRVVGVRPPDERRDGFRIRGASGETIRATRLILATGGLSLPLTGSDGFGLRLGEKLGHQVAPTHPALVPLLASRAWTDLSGVSVPVRLTAHQGDRVLHAYEGDFLFTHRGFSGPVVLDVSRHVTAPGAEGTSIRVHWGDVPDWDAALRTGGKGTVGTVVRDPLPRRLADALLNAAGVDAAARRSELSRSDRARLVDVLGRFPLPVAGSEGYRTAEVTAGGVLLDEVVTKSLESRIVPGLHLCGEVLDVTGRLGGYNFLWAWVSGRRAGIAAADGAQRVPA